MNALFSNSPAILLLLLGIFVVVVLVVATWVRAKWIRFRLKRRFTIAAVAESRAARLLCRLGYEILGAQVEGSYCLQVDGAPVSIALRADYLVLRSGKRYVAEVKSGAHAPKISTASTRRQLLEYRLAFDVSGVLLVDGSTEQVHSIEFPWDSHAGLPPTTFGPPVFAFGLLAALAVAVACAWCVLR